MKKFNEKNLYHLATSMLDDFPNKDEYQQYLKLIFEFLERKIEGLEESFIVKEEKNVYIEKDSIEVNNKIEETIISTILNAFNQVGVENIDLINKILDKNINLLKEDILLESTRPDLFLFRKFRHIDNDDILLVILKYCIQKDKIKTLDIINKEDLLSFAVSHSMFNTFDYLISLGIDVNKKNNVGKTPIMYVKTLAALKIFSKYKPDFFIKDNDGNDSINYMYTHNESKEMVAYALKDKSINNEQNVIEVLKKSNKKDEILNILSRFNGDLNNVRIDGDNILNYSIQSCKWSLTPLLISKFGIDVNFINENNESCVDKLFFNPKRTGDKNGSRTLAVWKEVIKNGFNFAKNSKGIGFSDKLFCKVSSKPNDFNWLQLNSCGYSFTKLKANDYFKVFLSAFDDKEIPQKVLDFIMDIDFNNDEIKAFSGSDKNPLIAFKLGVLTAYLEGGISHNIIQWFFKKIKTESRYYEWAERTDYFVKLCESCEKLGIPVQNKNFNPIFNNVINNICKLNTEKKYSEMTSEFDILSILIKNDCFFNLDLVSISSEQLNVINESLDSFIDYNNTTKNDKNTIKLEELNVKIKKMLLTKDLDSKTTKNNKVII